MATRNRASWKRRVLRGTAVLALLLTLAVALLPQILGTAPGRSLILGRINRAIAPGRIEATGLRFSWTGPIRAEGVVLRTGEGKAIVTAPSVAWDRGLWKLLTDRPRYGTITLTGAACDITRREDGSIDLVDALGLGSRKDAPEPPVPTKDDPSPPTVATLKIVGGSLNLRSPELPSGLVAETFDLTLVQPAPPSPQSFELRLKKPGGETLEIAGHLDAASAPSLTLSATQWPLDVAYSGLAGSGTFDGKAVADLRGGAVSASGDVRLSRVEATGPALGGDHVRLDRISGSWDVAQSEAGWTVKRLDVTSPIGSLKSDRPIPAPPGTTATISGRFALAALAKQAPHALGLGAGVAVAGGGGVGEVVGREDAGTQRLHVSANLSNISAIERGRPAPIVLREPATLSAEVSAKGRDIRVERLGLTASGLSAEGSGDLDKGVKVTGRFDLAALAKQARDLVDLGGMEPGGRGRFVGDYRRTEAGYLARYKAEVDAFSLARPGAGPIARDVVKLDGDVSGTADVTGLPTSWRSVRVGLGLPDLAASVTLSPRPDGLAITAAANRPMILGGRPGIGEVRGVVLWSTSGIEIGEVVATVTPAAPAQAVSLSASGRYDLGAGTLTLSPLPGGAIALAPSGLRLTGLGGSSGPLTIEGGLVGDLKAVDRLWAAYSGSEAYGLDGPCGLAINAAYHSENGRLDLTGLTVTSRYGSSAITGKIDDFSGLRDADLGGVLTIDKATLDALVTSAIAPDARLSARVRPFHLRGPLSGDILREIRAEGGLDIDGAEAAGLKLGSAQVIAQLTGGKVTVEPIRSTLNGGTVAILTEVTLDEAGGATVHLLPGTAIQDAVIDDPLSERLLSYVAPVLHEASQVRGRVSMVIDRASFPIGGPTTRPVSLAGSLEFQDVIFGPGPMASEVLNIVPLKREAQLRLNETIRVAVEKGRVYQKGLEVPVGGGKSFGLEGSVGFDRTLALKAMVPVAVPGVPGLAGRGSATETLADMRIPVPIGGTLAHPRIDRQALAKGLRDEGRSAIRREAEAGAEKLIRRLGSDVLPRRR